MTLGVKEVVRRGRRQPHQLALGTVPQGPSGTVGSETSVEELYQQQSSVKGGGKSSGRLLPGQLQ